MAATTEAGRSSGIGALGTDNKITRLAADKTMPDPHGLRPLAQKVFKQIDAVTKMWTGAYDAVSPAFKDLEGVCRVLAAQQDAAEPAAIQDLRRIHAQSMSVFGLMQSQVRRRYRDLINIAYPETEEAAITTASALNEIMGSLEAEGTLLKKALKKTRGCWKAKGDILPTVCELLKNYGTAILPKEALAGRSAKEQTAISELYTAIFAGPFFQEIQKVLKIADALQEDAAKKAVASTGIAVSAGDDRTIGTAVMQKLLAAQKDAGASSSLTDSSKLEDITVFRESVPELTEAALRDMLIALHTSATSAEATHVIPLIDAEGETEETKKALSVLSTILAGMEGIVDERAFASLSFAESTGVLTPELIGTALRRQYPSLTMLRFPTNEAFDSKAERDQWHALIKELYTAGNHNLEVVDFSRATDLFDGKDIYNIVKGSVRIRALDISGFTIPATTLQHILMSKKATLRGLFASQVTVTGSAFACKTVKKTLEAMANNADMQVYGIDTIAYEN